MPLLAARYRESGYASGTDTTGNGHDLTVVGTPVAVSAPTGGGLRFADGSYLIREDDADLLGGGEFFAMTLMYRREPRTGDAHDDPLVCLGDNARSNHRLSLFCASAENELRFSISNGEVLLAVALPAVATSQNADAYTYVDAGYDARRRLSWLRTFSHYRTTMLAEETRLYTNEPLPSATGRFVVGADAAGSGRFLEGSIADLRIYAE